MHIATAVSIILIEFNSIAFASNPILLPQDVQTNLSYLAFLGLFENCDFVVHLDDEGHDEEGDYIDGLLDKISDHHGVTVFRYDRLSMSVVLLRPNTARVVNLVWLQNPDTFIRFSHVIGNIVDTDSVIYFEGHSLNEAINERNRNFTRLYGTGVDNANMAFVVNHTTALGIWFYSAAEFEMDVEVINRTSDNVPQVHLYNNTFEDFRKFPMRIGYSNCAPFIYDDAHSHHILGVEYKVMEIMIKKLNITPILENYSKRRNSRITLIEDVNRTTLHFGIGCLSNNAIRDKLVAFSAAIQYEPHITMFTSTGTKYRPMALHALAAPLHEDVWLCCMLSLVVLTCCVRLVAATSQHITNSLFIPFSILLEQAVAVPRNNNAVRIGLCTWILVGFALSSSYKSKLTAGVIMPVTEEPETLDELLKEGYHFISPAEDSTYLIELLRISTDPVEIQIGQNIEDTKDVCEAIHRALTEQSAVVDERTVLRYKIWNECLHNLSRVEMRALRRLESATTVNGHVWAMQKHAPFKQRVSLKIEYLKSYGLIQKWYMSYNLTRPIPKSNSMRVNDSAVPLQMWNLASAYIVLACGYALAAIVLALEIFTKKASQSNRFKSANFKWKAFHFQKYRDS